MGLWIKTDVVRLDTDLLGVPMHLRGVWWTAELIGKRTEDDGWFRRALLVREGCDEALIAEAEAAEVIECADGLVRSTGYLDRNPSQDAIAAKRASKSEAGRKGNHERWDHPGSFADCPLCQVVAGSDRTGSQSDRKLSPESESKGASCTSDPTARPPLTPVADLGLPDPADAGDHRAGLAAVKDAAAKAAAGRAS